MVVYFLNIFQKVNIRLEEILCCKKIDGFNYFHTEVSKKCLESRIWSVHL